MMVMVAGILFCMSFLVGMSVMEVVLHHGGHDRAGDHGRMHVCSIVRHTLRISWMMGLSLMAMVMVVICRFVGLCS